MTSLEIVRQYNDQVAQIRADLVGRPLMAILEEDARSEYDDRNDREGGAR